MKISNSFFKPLLPFVFIFFLEIPLAFGGKIKPLQGPEHHAPDRDFHVIHYTLSLSFDAPQKTLFGKEKITLTPFHSGVDSIVLDAAKMDIHSIRLLPDKNLNFKKEPQKLIIRLNKPYSSKDTLTLAIDYTVKDPKKGLFFVLPQKGARKQHFEIYSQGEMEDNHYWFPCWDFPNDRATSEVFLTTKIPNIAISNGKLVGVTANRKDSTRTFHWKIDVPHVSYLTSIIVGNYKKVEDRYKKILVQYYVHPDQLPYARATFSKTPDIIAFFSKKIGVEYPYSKYAQTVVDNFMYGGMENISATTLTSATIRDQKSTIDGTSEGLIAHELAHQWWGDWLTCRDWTNAWLNEGFATYFASLWKEHSQGEDAFDFDMNGAARAYMIEDSTSYRRPLSWYHYQYPVNMFDRTAYQKGAWVLHMLRYVVGDELFWKGLHFYAATNAKKLVEAFDLKKAFEDGTGKNLYWFFKEWVYSAGYPKLDLTKSWIDSLHALALHVKQTQVGDTLTTVFRMPVRVELIAGNHHRTAQVTLASADTTFYLKCVRNPDLVIFDPGNHILKEMHFEKSEQEWLFQLAQAEHAIDRLHALNALKKSFKGDSVVQRAIAKQSRTDSYWGMRREAIRFLGTVHPEWAKSTLLAAAHDPKSLVRAEAVSALGAYKDSTLVPAVQNVFHTDSSYAVLSACIQTIAKLDSAHALPFLKTALTISSYNEQIRKAAVRALANLKTPEAVDILLPYGSLQYPATLRRSVIRAVSRVGKKNPKVVPFLIAHLSDPSNWARRQAAFSLSRMDDERAVEPLKKAIQREIDPRVKKSMEISLKHLEARLKIEEKQKNSSK